MSHPRHVDVYKDSQSLWRWRLVAANNSDVLADSGESYENLSDLLGIVNSLYPTVPVDVNGDEPA